MTRRNEEKGDETVAFRVPERMAAWLRDRARVHNTTPSCLMRSIVEEYLTQTKSANISDGNGRFANIPDPHVVEKLEAARTALDAAFQTIGMARAGGREVKGRKLA